MSTISTSRAQSHHFPCLGVFDLVVTDEKRVEEMVFDGWFDDLPSLSSDQTKMPLSLFTRQQRDDSPSLDIRRIIVDKVIALCCSALVIPGKALQDADVRKWLAVCRDCRWRDHKVSRRLPSCGETEKRRIR
jgi:hypothetical protein